MSYENKILQMKKMLGKKVQQPVANEQSTYQKPVIPNYVNQWEKAGLTRIDNEFGIVFKRQVHYPFHYQHGHYPLQSFFDALIKWQSADFDHPYALDVDENVLFFDQFRFRDTDVQLVIFFTAFFQLFFRKSIICIPCQ